MRRIFKIVSSEFTNILRLIELFYNLYIHRHTMHTIAIKSLFNIHPVVYSNIESGIFFLPTLNVVRTLFVDILSGNSVVYIFSRLRVMQKPNKLRNILGGSNFYVTACNDRKQHVTVPDYLQPRITSQRGHHFYQ